MTTYATYELSTYNLISVFTNKTEALASSVKQPQEFRTFKYLTKSQVESLSYAEAVSMELVFRSNNNELIKLLTPTTK